MRRHSFRLRLFGLSLALVAFGCRDFAIALEPEPDDPVAGDVEADIGIPFRLRLGESARLDRLDLIVRFVSVSEDSRCPLGNDCADVGEVSGAFRVERDTGGLPQGFQLGVPGFADSPFLRGDVFQSDRERFRLLWIGPYPEEGVVPDPDSLHALLRVDHDF